jgi:uncharacterized protein YjbI with pentapeptide repeats
LASSSSTGTMPSSATSAHSPFSSSVMPSVYPAPTSITPATTARTQGFRCVWLTGSMHELAPEELTRGVLIADAEDEGGDFANVAAPEISLTRVTFTRTRLTGAQLTRARIVDTTFRDCRIDLASFAGTTFERVTFAGCILTQTDFGNALLRKVRFEHCDLTEADLHGLRIDRCELRSCTLDGLIAPERLRGAAMPWPDVLGNAGLLASALGIRVLED